MLIFEGKDVSIKGLSGVAYASLMLLLMLSLVAFNVFAASVNGEREIFLDISLLKHEYFPENSVAEQNIIRVDDSHRDYAKTKYGIKLEDRSYTVALARDVHSGDIVAGLLTIEISYQESLVMLAVALSEELRVQRAAVIAVDKKYVSDFEATIGVGVIKRYTMTSVRQLKYLASVIKKKGGVAELVSAEIAMMAATLAAEMRN